MPDRTEINSFFDIIKLLKKGPKETAKTIVELVQDKGADVVDALKGKIVEKLSPLVEISPLERVRMSQGSEKTYLGKTIAEKIYEKLNEYKAQLEKIPNGELSDYRDDGLRLIQLFSEELKRYLEIFDVFMSGKTSRFSRNKGLSYDKLLSARKSMKLRLNNMCKLLNEYNKGDKYKYVKMREWLENEVKGDIEVATANLAKFIFKEAWKLIHDHTQKADLGYYADQTAMLKAYKESPEVHKALKDALARTEGLKWNDYTTNSFNDSWAIDANKGFKGTCKAVLAKEILNADYQGDPFKFCGLKATGSFMGDITKELEKCVNYTKTELDKVINLGAKSGVMSNAAGFNASDFGVNLETLIGDDYSQNREKWDPQTTTLKAVSNKDLHKKAKSLHSQVEKEYRKLKSYQKKFFPTSRPGQGELHHDFAELIVKLPSLRDQNGNKDYNIGKKYDELKKLYDDVNRNIGQTTKDDISALYVRKAKTFLKACEKWNGEECDRYESWLKDRDNSATYWLKQVKDHYKELCKEGEKINKDQKRQKQSVHKDWKKILDKSLKYIPSSVKLFVENFEANKNKARAFILLSINQGAVYGFTSLWAGERFVKFEGADERVRDNLLGPSSVAKYFERIGNDPREIDSVETDAEQAKQHPWSFAPPQPAPQGARRGPNTGNRRMGDSLTHVPDAERNDRSAPRVPPRVPPAPKPPIRT